MTKLTLCVDFDGVLHSYSSGWQGASVVADDPVPGAMHWLCNLIDAGFDVQIYSARSSQPGGIEAMHKAIVRWLLDDDSGRIQNEVFKFVDQNLSFPTEKPAAYLTIDDRAICFNGDFDEVSPNKIRAFQPWYKRDGDRRRQYTVWLDPDTPIAIRGTDAQLDISRAGSIEQRALVIFDGSRVAARFERWLGYRDES